MYRVHEFAELAGVTAKALYHYDRLGLLRPRRSAAGYRIYEERDLERLAQIVALRFLGLPLKEIRSLLGKDGLKLPEALRAQKAVLEERRQRLDRAIAAIEKAGEQAGPGVLKGIIQAIGMQNESVDFMKNYYREEAWSNFRSLHRVWPSKEWVELFGDFQESLDQDPAGRRAQDLAARWRRLRVMDSGRDSRVHSGLIRAWADRQYWPEEVQQKFTGLDLDRISEFAKEAFGAYRQDRFGRWSWGDELTTFSPAERERFPLAIADLYFRIDGAIDEDPTSAVGQALAARWMELVESRTGGPKGTSGQYERFMKWRQSWPEWLDQKLAAMPFDRILAFVCKAIEV